MSKNKTSDPLKRLLRAAGLVASVQTGMALGGRLEGYLQLPDGDAQPVMATVIGLVLDEVAQNEETLEPSDRGDRENELIVYAMKRGIELGLASAMLSVAADQAANQSQGGVL